MHSVEPYYHWRNLYIADEDENSPFYGREYSEFEFQNRVYNYLIHPQWDHIGSNTLYIKILYVDYEDGYAIIEFIGEWNDAIENDIMTLKRDILDEMIPMGVSKFIFIGENVLNFHASDDCYYEECIDDLEDGWIALINFHEHVESEMISVGIDQYFIMQGELDELDWRTYLPHQFYKKVKKIVKDRF
ncbi:MAG: hypothetical protein EP333_00610 [Bacteroidetes bacterium]|nr:MAG: hypothetical protein EP333_00610 [Bacteroidota bacterium]